METNLPENQQTDPAISVPPTKPLSPKKPCCKKVIWLGIGVIILALIGGGLVFSKDKLNISSPVPSQILIASPIPTSDLTSKPSGSGFVCPETEYIDCMPKIVDENTPEVNLKPDKRCTPEFLSWAKENCPGFKGAAY